MTCTQTTPRPSQTTTPSLPRLPGNQREDVTEAMPLWVHDWVELLAHGAEGKEGEPGRSSHAVVTNGGRPGLLHQTPTGRLGRRSG